MDICCETAFLSMHFRLLQRNAFVFDAIPVILSLLHGCDSLAATAEVIQTPILGDLALTD